MVSNIFPFPLFDSDGSFSCLLTSLERSFPYSPSWSSGSSGACPFQKPLHYSNTCSSPEKAPSPILFLCPDPLSSPSQNTVYAPIFKNQEAIGNPLNRHWPSPFFINIKSLCRTMHLVYITAGETPGSHVNKVLSFSTSLSTTVMSYYCEFIEHE